jgi:guanine deaminase
MATLQTPLNQVFLGTFIHSAKLGELAYLHDSAVFVDSRGTIAKVETPCDRQTAEEKIIPELGWQKDSVAVHTCREGQFYFPGFIGMCYFLHGSQSTDRTNRT